MPNCSAPLPWGRTRSLMCGHGVGRRDEHEKVRAEMEEAGHDAQHAADEASSVNGQVSARRQNLSSRATPPYQPALTISGAWRSLWRDLRKISYAPESPRFRCHSLNRKQGMSESAYIAAAELGLDPGRGEFEASDAPWRGLAGAACCRSPKRRAAPAPAIADREEPERGGAFGTEMTLAAAFLATAVIVPRSWHGKSGSLSCIRAP